MLYRCGLLRISRQAAPAFRNSYFLFLCVSAYGIPNNDHNGYDKHEQISIFKEVILVYFLNTDDIDKCPMVSEGSTGDDGDVDDDEDDDYRRLWGGADLHQ